VRSDIESVNALGCPWISSTGRLSIREAGGRLLMLVQAANPLNLGSDATRLIPPPFACCFLV